MTKVLNIDDLVEEPSYSVVIAGKTHNMKTPTMEDFIANLKDMEDLAASPNMLAEVEVTIRMISRAFPTLKESDIRKWPVVAIERLFAIIRGFDPDAKVEEVDASGNDKPET